ncbi:hypothetical protein CBL_00906 [Carabus blaptoides fortunei]
MAAVDRANVNAGIVEYEDGRNSFASMHHLRKGEQTHMHIFESSTGQGQGGGERCNKRISKANKSSLSRKTNTIKRKIQREQHIARVKGLVCVDNIPYAGPVLASLLT